MPERQQPPIAILGAGPSGLLLARLLHLQSISFTIFERSPSPSTTDNQGGSLDIHAATGQLAIKEAGLFEQFQKLIRYDSSTTIADRHGKVVVSFAPEASGGEGDRPEIDRRDLRGLLLGSLPEGSVRWGWKVEGVVRNETGGVEVRFEGGKVESGFKLVVGADGAWSKVRSLVTPAVPVYSGIFYMTTLVHPCDEIHPSVAKISKRGTYMALGNNREITAQRNGDDSYTVGVGLRGPADLFSSGMDPAKLRGELVRDHFSDWDAEVTGMVAKSNGEFRMWPLYAMPPESLSWASVEGVALVGDAAHVTTPFEGEGVNCALFDSLQLAQQIMKYGLDDLDTAVAEYEKLMLPRGADLIRRSAANGELLFAEDAPHSFTSQFEGMGASG